MLLISDGGLWLGATTKSWVVGRLGAVAAVVEDDARTLLVLLSRDWSLAKTELLELENRRPDLPPLSMRAAVQLALTGSSTWWAELALQWCADGFPLEGLEGEIDRLTTDRHLSQRGRHLAVNVMRSSE